MFRPDPEFTDEMGVDAVMKAVYNPTSLDDILDCNHTCVVDLFQHNRKTDNEVVNLVNGVNDLIRRDCPRDIIIKTKLLYALGGRKGQSLKIEQLYGIQLALWPKVLDMFRLSNDDATALGNIFCALKDCVVPLL